MAIVLEFIPGFMVGVEYLWDDKVFVMDLGILRIYLVFNPAQQEE